MAKTASLLLKVLVPYMLITQLVYSLICNFIFNIGTSRVSLLWYISNFSDGLEFLLTFQIVQFIVVIGLVYLHRIRPSSLFNWTGISMWVVPFTLIIGLQGLIFLLYRLFVDSEILSNSTQPNLVLTYLPIFLISAFNEEIVFRGILLEKLNQLPKIAGVLISSALFAAIHLATGLDSLLSFINIFLLGTLLCLLRLKYNLASAIIFHAVSNIIATLLQVDLGNAGFKLTTTYTLKINVPREWYGNSAEFISIVVLVIAIYGFIKISRVDFDSCVHSK